MATLLETGLLLYFTPIFVMLLVGIILFALLQKVKFISGQKNVNALIAFLIAFLFVLIPELTTIITLALPWFVILIVFLVFTILIFMFVGVSEESISNFFSSGQYPALFWILLLTSLAIFGYASMQVFGEDIQNITADSGDAGEENVFLSVGTLLFNPKILGMLLVLALAGLSIQFIGQTQRQIR